MAAYVEQLVRDKLLVGLHAVVNEFDAQNLEPEYPAGHPIEIEISGQHVWECGQYEGKLQIALRPVLWWNETERRIGVMNTIDRRLGRLKEITLYDGSRWRQISKDHTMFDPETPGEIFNVSTFYERFDAYQ
jgi:hypothetical protein